MSDLGRLFENDAQIGNALFVGARKLGLAVRVGIAGDKTTARIAARAGEVTVVPPGREPPFLAPLPVALLEPSPDTLATLQRWGVHTIGELEALPAGGVAVRLGAEGAHLARVARGQADTPLAPLRRAARLRGGHRLRLARRERRAAPVRAAPARREPDGAPRLSRAGVGRPRADA